VKTFLAILADFLGRVLAKLIPALGREIRKNNTVKQTGADHETVDSLDTDIWAAANDNRVQRHVQSQDRTAPGRADSDH
jgi:hypothetical protein